VTRHSSVPGESFASSKGGYVNEWMVAIGVDTHKRTHMAAALDRQGNQLGLLELEASERGFQQLWEWARRLGRCAFAIEGAGSYGAALARFLLARGAEVYECERPRRGDRRRGKNDQRDALLAARRLLAPAEGLSQLRGGGALRETLRVLLLERASAEQARTAALNQLHSLAVTAPLADCEGLRRLRGEPLARAAAALVDAQAPPALVEVLRRLGERALALSTELQTIAQQLKDLLAEQAAPLLAECGVGPISAAQMLVSSGDPRRMRSEGSFAALGGTSPVEASSGPLKRHRLNRGGDRQLNKALHMIALNRCRFHPETAAYYTRLLERGKTKREARRCVKRMLARRFYHQLCALPDSATAT
jgi:transposase